jgi:excinuclease ABC subunit C
MPIHSPDPTAAQTPPAGGRGRPRAPSGPAVIRAHLRTLPGGPGVYRMIGRDAEVLYVGKARSLKKRVASYTRMMGHTNRIARMIAETADMEFMTTASESEALLLEANLIKRLKPRYNVSFRDDKSFPYILIARDHPAARIMKHRGAHSRPGDYFGPFASAGAVNRTVNALQRAFLIRSCTDAVYDSRTRPCLLFQIKRCSAPCTGEVTIAEHDRLVAEAKDFLSGRASRVRGELVSAMAEAAGGLDYERAAVYRDRLAALAQVQAHQGINPHSIDDADVFAAHQAGGQTCVQVFFFRSGQNWGNRAYFPRADRSLGAAEVLEAFVSQFYDDRPAPPRILLSHAVDGADLLSQALSLREERKVEVTAPRRGEKREVVDHALTNAREALGRRLAESGSQTKLLEGLGRTLGLDSAPARVEVFDNSHIAGTLAVGAMVVAGPEGLEKSQYRKFNIKAQDLAPGDDYAMMAEVLTRRFKRMLKEEESGEARRFARPDLVIVDGGAGQLAAALAVMAELGVDDIPVAAVAKGPERDAGREHIHLPGRAPFRLEARDPVLYFIQRLRDEAHRFAIGSHRARRSRAIGASPLDEIAGVGAARKSALLRHFGTSNAVSRAAPADLAAVPGISAHLAATIYDHFHEKGD